MDDDSTFRLLLLVLGLVTLPVGLYHRIRAETGEKIDRWQEGIVILVGLRLTGLVLFVAGIAWMINPQSMAWSALAIPVWLRWCGFALAAAAGLLWCWTVHTLDKNLTDTVVTRKEHTLVVTGPYRWIRHPFYTSVFVGGLAGSLAIANWFILALGAIVCMFLIARTTIEERKLIERFGDDYRELMRRTGRFLPRLFSR